MPIKKSLIIDFLGNLPEECNAEEVLYAVQLLEDIATGEEDASKSRFIDQSYVGDEVEKWLSE